MRGRCSRLGFETIERVCWSFGNLGLEMKPDQQKSVRTVPLEQLTEMNWIERRSSGSALLS